MPQHKFNKAQRFVRDNTPLVAVASGAGVMLLQFSGEPTNPAAALVLGGVTAAAVFFGANYLLCGGDLLCTGVQGVAAVGKAGSGFIDNIRDDLTSENPRCNAGDNAVAVTTAWFKGGLGSVSACVDGTGSCTKVIPFVGSIENSIDAGKKYNMTCKR